MTPAEASQLRTRFDGVVDEAGATSGTAPAGGRHAQKHLQV